MQHGTKYTRQDFEERSTEGDNLKAFMRKVFQIKENEVEKVLWVQQRAKSALEE